MGILNNHQHFNKWQTQSGMKPTSKSSLTPYLAAKSYTRTLMDSLPECLKVEIIRDLNKKTSGKESLSSTDRTKTGREKLEVSDIQFMVNNLNTNSNHLDRFKKIKDEKGIFDAFGYLYRMTYQ